MTIPVTPGPPQAEFVTYSSSPSVLSDLSNIVLTSLCRGIGLSNCRSIVPCEKRVIMPPNEQIPKGLSILS